MRLNFDYISLSVSVGTLVRFDLLLEKVVRYPDDQGNGRFLVNQEYTVRLLIPVYTFKLCLKKGLVTRLLQGDKSKIIFASRRSMMKY